jgi:hypothetical protein
LKLFTDSYVLDNREAGQSVVGDGTVRIVPPKGQARAHNRLKALKCRHMEEKFK